MNKKYPDICITIGNGTIFMHLYLNNNYIYAYTFDAEVYMQIILPLLKIAHDSGNNVYYICSVYSR